MTVPTNEFWVHCQGCGHAWVLFYTPMEVDKMRHFENPCCPKCHEGGGIFIGKGNDQD